MRDPVRGISSYMLTCVKICSKGSIVYAAYFDLPVVFAEGHVLLVKQARVAYSDSDVFSAARGSEQDDR